MRQVPDCLEGSVFTRLVAWSLRLERVDSACVVRVVQGSPRQHADSERKCAQRSPEENHNGRIARS
jgi:hypothetical protein